MVVESQQNIGSKGGGGMGGGGGDGGGGIVYTARDSCLMLA